MCMCTIATILCVVIGINAIIMIILDYHCTKYNSNTYVLGGIFFPMGITICIHLIITTLASHIFAQQNTEKKDLSRR